MQPEVAMRGNGGAVSAPIPPLGLGTYRRTGDEGVAAILTALELGYRHIDTAQNYDNEDAVGEAVRRSGLARDAVFITTKVADSNLDRGRFADSVARSLERLGTGRVDLLLIHWPSAHGAVPLEEYLNALAEAQARGQARLIGVSNFTIELLERAEVILGPGALATNQVELHPWLQQPRLRDWARRRGLMLTAYEPLVRGRVLSEPAVLEIAERHGVTPAEVVLAFLLTEGHAAIPASSQAEHLRTNLAAAALALAPDEVARMRALDRGMRTIDPPKAPRWDD
ncbi:MAG: aldo/keto reductase [Amaricoccus sp.]